MLLADTLVVVGLATVSLGTVQETGGVREHTFLLHNPGPEAVTVVQSYTSCECTTIDTGGVTVVEAGDTSAVTLRYDPRGRGGAFTASGTVVYGPSRKRVRLSLTGTGVLSEETLLRRFPVAVSDHLRLSTDRFDLGVVRPGETRRRTVMVLHRDNGDSVEQVDLTFTPDASTPKGLRHVPRTFTVTDGDGKRRQVTVTFDVLVQ